MPTHQKRPVTGFHVHFESGAPATTISLTPTDFYFVDDQIVVAVPRGWVRRVEELPQAIQEAIREASASKSPHSYDQAVRLLLSEIQDGRFATVNPKP